MSNVTSILPAIAFEKGDTLNDDSTITVKRTFKFTGQTTNHNMEFIVHLDAWTAEEQRELAIRQLVIDAQRLIRSKKLDPDCGVLLPEMLHPERAKRVVKTDAEVTKELLGTMTPTERVQWLHDNGIEI